ncbi:MAG: hypothetical protein IT324_19495 [Anaerolineae bacterium]|nr:hypothetical protein [Anaerolineae bacterium]
MLDGTKTQTRRLVKPGEKLIQAEYFGGGYKPLWVEDAKQKRVYTVGTYFAVQPDRGRVSLARAFLTDIRREDVKAEGYAQIDQFFKVWCAMHDQPALREYDRRQQYAMDMSMRDFLIDKRPDNRYQAWVLTFHLVRARK